MIVIGKSFENANIGSYLVRVDIDDDRRTEIAKDMKSGSFCIRFWNGSAMHDIVLTPEAMLALCRATMQAVANPDVFVGADIIALQVYNV